MLKKAANLATEGTALAGHLVVTTDRLIHQCHAVERMGRFLWKSVDANDRYWPRAGTRAELTVIEDRVNVGPGVKITLADGRTYDFSMWHADEVVQVISDLGLPPATQGPDLVGLPRRRLARPQDAMVLALALLALDALVLQARPVAYVLPGLVALWSAVSYVRARTDASAHDPSDDG